MPNIQLDQLGSEELYEALKARFYALPDVEEGPGGYPRNA